VPDAVQSIVLLGGPGLLLGAATGTLVRSLWMLLVLVALSIAALLYGINHVPTCGDEDDCPSVLVAIAMMTNFAGWLVGLAVGVGVVRARGRA
jgi:hypothetical protein